MEKSSKLETINGFPIIAQFATLGTRMTLPGRVILVDRGEGYSERYVRSWQGWRPNEGWASSWDEGSYFCDLRDAVRSFTAAASREVERRIEAEADE